MKLSFKKHVAPTAKLTYKVFKEALVVYVLLYAAAIAPDFQYNQHFMTLVIEEIKKLKPNVQVNPNSQVNN